MKKILIVLLSVALIAGAAACAPKYEAVKLDKDFPDDYEIFDDAIVLDSEEDDLEYVVVGGDVLDVVDFYEEMIDDIDFEEDDEEFEARGEYAGFEYRINIELDEDVFVRIRLKEAGTTEAVQPQADAAVDDAVDDTAVDDTVEDTAIDEPTEEPIDEPVSNDEVDLSLLEGLNTAEYDSIYMHIVMEMMGFEIDMEIYEQDDYSKTVMESAFVSGVSIYNPEENKTYTYIPGDSEGTVSVGDQTDEAATMMDTSEMMQFVNEDTIVRKEVYEGVPCIYLHLVYEEEGMTNVIDAWFTEDYGVPLYMIAYVDDELALEMTAEDYSVNEPIDPAEFELPAGVTFTE